MHLELLQSLYTGQSRVTHEDRIYRLMLADLEQSSISPQLYQRLKESGYLHQVPDFFRKGLQAEHERALFQNIFIRSEEEIIRTLFEERRIEAVPLKGTRFAERCFGHIGARATSDIDLLIRPSDIQKAIVSLQSIGYQEEGDDDDGHFHFSLSKPIESSDQSLRVELHWSLVKERSSRLQIDHFWEETTPIKGGFFVQELSIPRTFYAICLHGANHRMDSLKYVLDIVQMLERFSDQIDFEKLFEQAKRDLVYRRVHFALSVAYRLFPHLQEVKPLRVDQVSSLYDHSMSRSTKSWSENIRFLLFVTVVYVWVYDRWGFRIQALRMLFIDPSSRLTGRIGKYLRRQRT